MVFTRQISGIARRIGTATMVCGAVFAATPTLADTPAGSDWVQSGPGWVRGKVDTVAATPAGILIAFKGKLQSENCSKSASYYILISKDDYAMTSLFLTAWGTGKRRFSVYNHDYAGTSPANPYADRGDKYCTAAKISVN